MKAALAASIPLTRYRTAESGDLSTLVTLPGSETKCQEEAEYSTRILSYEFIIFVSEASPCRASLCKAMLLHMHRACERNVTRTLYQIDAPLAMPPVRIRWKDSGTCFRPVGTPFVRSGGVSQLRRASTNVDGTSLSRSAS